MHIAFLQTWKAGGIKVLSRTCSLAIGGGASDNGGGGSRSSSNKENVYFSTASSCRQI